MQLCPRCFESHDGIDEDSRQADPAERIDAAVLSQLAPRPWLRPGAVAEDSIVLVGSFRPSFKAGNGNEN